MKKAKISILILGSLLIPAHKTNAVFDYFTRDGVIKFSAVVSALTFTLVIGREVKRYLYPQEAELNVQQALTEMQLRKIVKTESNAQLIERQLTELLNSQATMQGQLNLLTKKLLPQEGGAAAAQVVSAPPSYSSNTAGLQRTQLSLGSTEGRAKAASVSHPSSPTPSTDGAAGAASAADASGRHRRTLSSESGVGSFAVVRNEEGADSHHQER